MKTKVYHRWTKTMESWLKKNFHKIGDKELAEKMNTLFPHRYRWTLKHIEKKRTYLNLKRTKKEVFKLRQQMNLKIDRKKMWDKRGRTQIRTIKKWVHSGALIEYIKLQDRFVRLSRYTWELHNGIIPKGYNVVSKDKIKTAGNIDNLILLSNAELAIMNKLSQYPDEIKQAKIILYNINKTINEKQNFRPKQSSVRAA